MTALARRKSPPQKKNSKQTRNKNKLETACRYSSTDSNVTVAPRPSQELSQFQ
jgi:hypothetical protein